MRDAIHNPLWSRDSTIFQVMPVLAMAVGLLFAATAAAQTVSTLATGFNGSGDVAVDEAGDIFVGNFGVLLSNANGNQVLRFTPEGQVSVFAGGLNGASGNTFDTQGNLYQSNIGAGAVMQISPDGTVSTYASGFSGPIGLAFDSQGNLYVNNCATSVISRVDPQRNVSVFVSGFPLSCPNGLTVDDEDNLYAVNFNNGAIVKVTPDQQMSVLATTPGATFRPGGGNGHVIFGNGRLYVASNAASKIFRVSLQGELSEVAGSGVRGHADGPAAQAQFSFPNGIDLSPDGRTLYVNESESTVGTTLTNNFPLTPNRLRAISLPEDEIPFGPINVGLAGAWFEPETSGQGLFIDVIDSGNQLFIGWFTYLPRQGSTPVSTNQWYTLQGPFEGATAELSIFLTEGGFFDDPEDTMTNAVGSAVLNFLSCTEATLDYAFDNGPSGTIDLTRLTPDVLCEVLDG